jgi:predicted RNA binding protein YcfA (HicA-like mRNA interferase family)
MPRKLRQLKADLRKAGFFELRERGKGSHTRWEHPDVAEVAVTLAGHDGDDAKDYQESAVRRAIARVVRAPSKKRGGNLGA